MRTSPGSPWWFTGLMALLCVAVLAAAWLPALPAPYQYDDTITPQSDPASQSLTSWSQALPRTLRPLTKLTYALESSLGITDASGRRALNALLFVTASLLLALLAELAGLPPGLGGALACVWAVHPVHGETIVRWQVARCCCL